MPEALVEGDGHDERCDDLTRAPRGYLRCLLPLGHDTAPGASAFERTHAIDPSGPWYRLVQTDPPDQVNRGAGRTV